MNRVLLLAGRPGTGKTFLIREAIAESKTKAGGFYTEEIRLGGLRQGFGITSLDGQHAVLAHVSISSQYQVSKYKIDIGSLDRVGVGAIRQALSEQCDLIVIDEIGKMELLSPQFREAVWQAINSGKKVLGSVVLGPHPFADEIKNHPEVKMLSVTSSNHGQVMGKILNWLETDR
ncbi:MAG: AAA family ATPase [Dehalococcoidia bacterium]|nr:AAA family ATPase [Dehalococcoidia bacterium]